MGDDVQLLQDLDVADEQADHIQDDVLLDVIQLLQHDEPIVLVHHIDRQLDERLAFVRYTVVQLLEGQLEVVVAHLQTSGVLVCGLPQALLQYDLWYVLIALEELLELLALQGAHLGLEVQHRLKDLPFILDLVLAERVGKLLEQLWVGFIEMLDRQLIGVRVDLEDAVELLYRLEVPL